MAANLAKAGHAVTGFDLVAPMAEGVASCTLAVGSVAGAEVVIIIAAQWVNPAECRSRGYGGDTQRIGAV